MSGASNARSLDIFEPFPAILRHWEVENFWKKQSENGILILKFELPGVSFSKNREKSLSAVAKSFLRVVWCSNLYQTIAWTLRNIFHMHNMLKKVVEQILRAKNGASLAFEKRNLWPLILGFSPFRVWFSKNREKSLSVVAKSFLRVVWCSKLYQKITWTLRSIFYMHNVLKKYTEKILQGKN